MQSDEAHHKLDITQIHIGNKCKHTQRSQLNSKLVLECRGLQQMMATTTNKNEKKKTIWKRTGTKTEKGETTTNQIGLDENIREMRIMKLKADTRCRCIRLKEATEEHKYTAKLNDNNKGKRQFHFVCL